MDLDISQTPALAVLYATILCPAIKPEIEDVFTIEPGAYFFIIGIAYLLPRKTLSVSIFITF